MRTVIVADKQDITRIGIESLVSEIDKTASLIKANNKSELIKLLMSNSDAIVILDYVLSDFTSIDDLLNLSYRFDGAKWFLFSEELNNDFLKRLVINSDNYSVVLKSCDLDEINMGLLQTFRGTRFICNRVMNQLLELQKKPTEHKLDHVLTPSEKEILKEIALGHTTKEIAAHRNLSFHTVITHRKNIFRKLDVNNVHEAIKHAMRAGLVDLAEYYI